jgi:hypothetical protein
MKETPKIIYNTNVFKNVKLAMTEDEIKADETQVVEVSNFLKDS